MFEFYLAYLSVLFVSWTLFSSFVTIILDFGIDYILLFALNRLSSSALFTVFI
jgi:hypothetical protein